MDTFSTIGFLIVLLMAGIGTGTTIHLVILGYRQHVKEVRRGRLATQVADEELDGESVGPDGTITDRRTGKVLGRRLGSLRG